MAFKCRPSRLILAALLAALFGLACPPAWAQGEAFQISQESQGQLSHPALTRVKRGGFAVAWSEDDTAGEQSSVHAQLFDAQGQAVGQPWSRAAGAGSTPRSSLAGLRAGNWALAWEYQSGPDNGWDIQGQIFDAAGNPLNGPLWEATPHDERSPALAALADGGLVMAWLNGAPGASQADMQYQIYDHQGTQRVRGELRYDLAHTAPDSRVRAAGLPDGSFVLVWDGYDYGSHTHKVFFQRLSTQGYPLGDITRVNFKAPDHQIEPVIASLACGDLAIAWLDAGGRHDISDYSIYLRRFAANGEPLADEVLVTFSRISSQEPVAGLAGLGDYGYVLVGSRDDCCQEKVFGQVWDAGGVPVGGVRDISLAESGPARRPAVAQTVDDGWVAVWDQNADQAGLGAIMGRMY